MRTVYLPYAIEIIARILSYIAVILLDIIHFVLTPFTWIKAKAHLAMIAVAAGGYIYLQFVVHHEKAIWVSLACLFAAIVAVILIKCIRKLACRIRQPLMRTVYSPVGVCIRFRMPFIALCKAKRTLTFFIGAMTGLFTCLKGNIAPGKRNTPN